MNIYVEGFSKRMIEDHLRERFEMYGTVSSCLIIKDKVTSESKRFGFVEMPNDHDARAAINGLHATDIGGGRLVVNEARPGPRS
jgi:RNA recognition motif-containing protein